MLHITPTAIEGKKFVGFDKNTEYTCIGYAANETFLVVGALWDQASNRFTIKTFKFQDVTFIGKPD
jgi:hypothetical protein